MNLEQATLAQRMSKIWTPEQLERFARAWTDPKIARADLPALIGRNMEAMTRQAHRMRLGRRPADLAAAGEWTAQDVATLRELWPQHTRQEVAERMERSVNAVSKKAHDLGLSRMRRERPPATLEQLAAARAKTAAILAANPNASRRTPERKIILCRDWPTHRPAYAITAEMNERPGLPVSNEMLARWARDLGLRRPDNFRPTSAPGVPRAKPKTEARMQPVIVARSCLCCGRAFKAPGRFIRLCDPCRRAA